MRVVHVNLVNQPYDVIVEPGILSRAGAIIQELTGATRCCILLDERLRPRYLPTLRASFPAGAECLDVWIPSGEENKSLQTVARAYDEVLRFKIDRRTPIVAFGGGVTGDLAGFVAATVLRGVPFIQVPTTLLAMVDASVGGKTGIDHAVGKNLIGAFHQPRVVLIDPEVLKTLPARQLRAGLAECIKHEIIRDADGFAKLEQSIGRALALDMDYLSELIAHNVAIKARVVEADPFEKGERAHLNFGHTFGHAIETVSEYEYSHGECVALGMTAATFAAEKLGMLEAGDRQRIIEVIRRAGLPTGGMILATDPVVNAMFYDKKVAAGKLRFVLPDRIGHVIIRDDVPMEIVREAVESLRG